MSEVPLHGTCKTVQARIWPWLSGPKFLERFMLFPLRCRPAGRDPYAQGHDRDGARDAILHT